MRQSGVVSQGSVGSRQSAVGSRQSRVASREYVGRGLEAMIVAHGSGRRRTLEIGALACAALAVGGAVLATVSAPDAGPREIRLVVRDMTYFVAGSGDGNPTLRLARGEKIRLVLTNDDPGYSHNVIAPVLGISTPLLTHGRSQTVEVTVPDVPGVYKYACGPHSEMMRGNISIE
jgi:plastocyanin